LDPSIGTLLNLGLCEEALGRTATAWTMLREFVDSAPTSDSRLGLARKKITKLEAELPWVRLVLAPGTEQVVVYLDGIELRGASLSEAVPVDPGEHSARVSLSTGETSELRFQIHRGEKLDVRLLAPSRLLAPVATKPALPASSPEPVPPKAAVPATGVTPTPHDRNGERVAAYVVGAVGVAGLVTGTVFGLMALRDRNVVRDHCPNHECQDQAGLDAVESGPRNETVANVALVVGALGLLTGGVLLWHSGRTTAGLSVGPNSASLSLIGVIE
jgi:hypothetical protein